MGDNSSHLCRPEQGQTEIPGQRELTEVTSAKYIHENIHILQLLSNVKLPKFYPWYQGLPRKWVQEGGSWSDTQVLITNFPQQLLSPRLLPRCQCVICGELKLETPFCIRSLHWRWVAPSTGQWKSLAHTSKEPGSKDRHEKWNCP